MRGRRPQPEAIKAQKRAVRSTRAKPQVEVPARDVGNIAAPAWLKNGKGLEIWRRLAPSLRAAKLLARVDAETFARYCSNFSRWLAMQGVIDSEGATYESESQHGKLKRAHPAFLIADRLERQLLAAEDRFGLNPSERQRIYAQRAQNNLVGDLFGDQARPQPDRPNAETAAAPAAAAQPAEPSRPMGFLN